MKINQQTIAEELNVSIITVSRALRGHPDLAEATRQRVLTKAKELGYTKHMEKTAPPAPTVPQRIGIIFYENSVIGKDDPLKSGVKRNIFLAIQRQCQRNQIETVVETPSPDEVPLLIRNKTINAAFIFGRYTKETLQYFKDIPTLAVSSFISSPNIPRIVANNVGGMRMATEHLIELGHKKILFMGLNDRNTKLLDERKDGYILAMHQYGLEAKTYYCNGYEDIPTETISKYTAIACASDSLADSIYLTLLKGGWKLPHECSISSFDNLPDVSRHGITTYAPDWEMMGTMAADILISKPLDVRGKELIITVPGKMLIRDSTIACTKH